jgi:hypothetical protein
MVVMSNGCQMVVNSFVRLGKYLLGRYRTDSGLGISSGEGGAQRVVLGETRTPTF